MEEVAALKEEMGEHSCPPRSGGAVTPRRLQLSELDHNYCSLFSVSPMHLLSAYCVLGSSSTEHMSQSCLPVAPSLENRDPQAGFPAALREQRCVSERQRGPWAGCLGAQELPGFLPRLHCER